MFFPSECRNIVSSDFYLLPAGKATDPVVQSLGEAQTHAVVGLEELVGEVLREEGKHEVGALGVRPERSPLQQSLNQQLRVRQFFLALKKRGGRRCGTRRYIIPLVIIRGRASLKTVTDAVHTSHGTPVTSEVNR